MMESRCYCSTSELMTLISVLSSITAKRMFTNMQTNKEKTTICDEKKLNISLSSPSVIKIFGQRCVPLKTHLVKTASYNFVNIDYSLLAFVYLPQVVIAFSLDFVNCFTLSSFSLRLRRLFGLIWHITNDSLLLALGITF